jgi:hypothetical protein
METMRAGSERATALFYWAEKAATGHSRSTRMRDRDTERDTRDSSARLA